MITYLFSIVLTPGADKMAATDPHGWTLTIISVSVVFTALIILYFLYSFSGYLFTRKPKQKKAKASDDAVAAAIALALQQEAGDDTSIAIAAALALELQGGVHDVESGIITIKHSGSAWDEKSLNFRKKPHYGNL